MKQEVRDISIPINVDTSRQSFKQTKEKNENGSQISHIQKPVTTLVTADGKVKRDINVEQYLKGLGSVKKAPKTNVKKSLQHLAKMVKGCYLSRMAGDVEFSIFCEDAISNLIQKKAEELSISDSSLDPNSVYVKKADRPLGGKIGGKQSIRSDERVLDCMEIEDSKGISREDKKDLIEKIFTHPQHVKKLDSDHIYRYFSEKMSKSGSEEFKDIAKHMDFTNYNIERIKALLEEEKGAIALDTQKILDAKKEKRQKEKKKEKVSIAKKSVKKVTKKKKVVKKKAKRRTPKK